MNVSLVASRYANALFELAVEKNDVEQVLSDASVIMDVCSKSRDLQLFLKSPVIHSDKKGVVIKEVFGKSVGKLTLTFMLVLIRKRREKYIPEIVKEVIVKIKEYKNILTVHFKSVIAPDTETKRMVLEVMKNYSKSNIELIEEIDASLVGGFVLSWHDKQYDASIMRQIDRMKKGLARINLYKKGY
ncbi:MAG: ATP synthase F1 subunit delta [bacterium]